MAVNVKPEDVLFIDIETVPAAPEYNALDPVFQYLWDKKSMTFRSADQSAGDIYERAGIYAEFGRIICISAGLITGRNPFSFRLKSFFGDDEKQILTEFSEMLLKFVRNREARLCAHNGREFDYPYIARRMIVNKISIPDILDNAGKKPWDVKLLDTLDLWKFGDYKSYTSLELLTAILGIQSPKDDIDGSVISKVYWQEHDIDRIVKYCEKDVLAVARVLMRLMNLPYIDENRVESVSFS